MRRVRALAPRLRNTGSVAGRLILAARLAPGARAVTSMLTTRNVCRWMVYVMASIEEKWIGGLQFLHIL